MRTYLTLVLISIRVEVRRLVRVRAYKRRRNGKTERVRSHYTADIRVSTVAWIEALAARRSTPIPSVFYLHTSIQREHSYTSCIALKTVRQFDRGTHKETSSTGLVSFVFMQVFEFSFFILLLLFTIWGRSFWTTLPFWAQRRICPTLV